MFELIVIFIFVLWFIIDKLVCLRFFILKIKILIKYMLDYN